MICARLLPRVRRVSSRTRLRNRARDCGAMRRRGCSPFVKPKPRNLRAGPEAKASRRSSRSCPSTSSGGAATSDSARPRRCCANLTNGPDEGCVPWSGCNGNEGLLVMPNCDAAASAGIRRRKPPVAHVVLGGSATVPHLPWLYRTPHSNRSVLQLLRYQASLIYRTAVYGPVCTVVWEGRSREAPPYPDPSGLRHSASCRLERDSSRGAAQRAPHSPDAIDQTASLATFNGDAMTAFTSFFETALDSDTASIN